MNLKGKIAIVTGASSGMGRATSLALSAEGVRLALVSKTPEKLDAVKSEIKQKGGEAVALPTDVTKAKQVEEMAERAFRHFRRIDILINSAFWGPPGSLEETTEDFWNRTIDTTLKGPFLCARSVVPYMRKNGGGRIINIGSLAGKIGEDNRTAYCAAKWGLEGLSAALREELLRDNIHVHLISPAATDTPFWTSSGAKLTPDILERFIPVETIADTIIWMISQPDQVHIPDIPVYNFRNPFEGKSSPFAD